MRRNQRRLLSWKTILLNNVKINTIIFSLLHNIKSISTQRRKARQGNAKVKKYIIFSITSIDNQ